MSQNLHIKEALGGAIPRSTIEPEGLENNFDNQLFRSANTDSNTFI